MAQFRPRPAFSDRGRLLWLAAAVVLGVVAIVVAFMRGDVVAAVFIALALGAILATRVWARGTRDEDDDTRDDER